MTDREVMQQALEALQYASTGNRRPEIIGPAIIVLRTALAMHQVSDFAQAQEQQAEPVAWFDWMPKGATHIAKIKVKTTSGGKLELRTHAFKYDNEVLMVYTTDNDNEYPGWREAKQCFYHLNFPVFPLYTSPPQRQWVGLTKVQQDDFADAYGSYEAVCAIEQALKERNND